MPNMTDVEIEKALKDRAYQVSYTDGDMRKGYIITPKDKLSQEALAYIDRLKETCQSAIESFTRMETLYKVKCTELEYVRDKVIDKIAEELNKQSILQLTDREWNDFIRRLANNA